MGLGVGVWNFWGLVLGVGGVGCRVASVGFETLVQISVVKKSVGKGRRCEACVWTDTGAVQACLGTVKLTPPPPRTTMES